MSAQDQSAGPAPEDVARMHAAAEAMVEEATAMTAAAIRLQIMMLEQAGEALVGLADAPRESGEDGAGR